MKKTDKQLTKEYKRFQEAELKLELYSSMWSRYRALMRKLVITLKEAQDESVPSWFTVKELRDLRKEIDALEEKTNIPKGCRNLKRFHSLFIKNIQSILDNLKKSKQVAFRKIERLCKLFEKYEPKIDKEMTKHDNALDKALKEIEKLDNWLFEELTEEGLYVM